MKRSSLRPPSQAWSCPLLLQLPWFEYQVRKKWNCPAWPRRAAADRLRHRCHVCSLRLVGGRRDLGLVGQCAGGWRSRKCSEIFLRQLEAPIPQVVHLSFENPAYAGATRAHRTCGSVGLYTHVHHCIRLAPLGWVRFPDIYS